MISDIRDFSVLTPSHFLIGDTPISVPEFDNNIHTREQILTLAACAAGDATLLQQVCKECLCEVQQCAKLRTRGRNTG